MKVPLYARYDYCYKKSCEFLEEFHIKYSDLMKTFQYDRLKVIRCLGSKDGFTTWDGENYSIAYNDDACLGARTRFTLMHEIGHIYLKHLVDFESTKIYRGSLSKQENKVLENEANAFARNVLSPVSMYLTLKNKSVSNVAYTFGITEAAASARIDFINRDIQLTKNLNLSQKIMLVYHRFMNKRKCTTCGTQFFEKLLYCPICGSKNSLQWGDGTMIYPKLDTYDNGKLTKCLTCGNEETDITGEYCQICGDYLINRCSYDGCSHKEPLPTNARYCPVCGSATTFYNNNFLKAWDYRENTSFTPDGFMNIPDSIVDEPVPWDGELPFN